MQAASGDIYVSDEDANQVFRIDPATGTATPVIQGIPFEVLTNMAYEPPGRLLLTEDTFPGDLGAVYRFDITTSA